jgi:S-DNA-T family DNA segregation ATPase FtsK/SpoIIIE
MASRLLTFRGRGITTHTDAPAPLAPPEPPKPRPSLRPILPPWLRHRAELRNTAHWAVRHVAHLGALHAVRLPLYGGRLLIYSPRGAWRAFASGTRWLFDADGLTVQRHAITSLASSVMGHERSGHVSQYRSLSKEHGHRVRGRLIVVAIAGVFGLPMLASYPRLPLLGVLVGIGLLGWHGRRKDRPIVDSGVIEAPGVRTITPDMVVAAFHAASLGSEKEPITFQAPGVHRDGKGFAARIVLPIGVTVAKAVEKLEVIASGLDVQKVQVFLSQMPVASERSERRVMLWVADTDPYASKSPITPLAKMDRLDFWKGFPFGIDAKSALVSWSLVFSGMLTGAQTRMGKTFAARIPVAAAALDPYVSIIVANLKGDNAWKPFQGVAHWYRSGVRTAVMRATVEMLRDQVEEMNRRQELIETLPHDRCPESKLTPALARDKRLNMGLRVIAIDEVQRLLECETPAWDEDDVPTGRGRPKKIPTVADMARLYLTDLAKVGSSSGIMLDLATQDPNSDILPTGIRGQLGKRFALKVRDYQASNCILGTGCSSKGWDASKLEDRHKGVGWLLGNDDSELSDSDAQIVRTHFMDLPTLQAICDRGRELRIKAGTLTGEAAGEALVVETPARPFLDDVRAVFGIGETRLWSEQIASRLAERWPETYDGWDASDLGTQLGRHNVKTVQVWGETPEGTNANRKGVTLESLADTELQGAR